MKLTHTIWLILITSVLNAQDVSQPELVLPSGHTGTVRFGRFSPDDKYVITGGEDRLVNIWETFSGLKIRSFSSGLSSIKNVGFSPNGKAVFVQTDSSFLLWSFPSFRKVLQLYDLRDARVSADGKIYSLGKDGNFEKFNSEGKKEWSRQVRGKNLFVSPDGLSIAVSTPERVHLFENNGKETGAISVLDAQLVEFIPGGRNLVILSKRSLYRYESAKDSMIELERAPDGFYQSGNGRYLIRTYFDGPYVAILDVHKGEEVLNFANVYSRFDTLALVDSNGETRYEVGKMNISAPGRSAAFNGLVISDNGEYLSSESNLWELKNVERSYEIELEDPVFHRFSGDFSKDSRYLLVLTSPNAVGLWDLEKRSFVSGYKGTTGRISTVNLDRSGRNLASVEGAQCKIISVSTGKTLHVLSKHTNDIGSAIFNPEGTQLLTNSFDTTACLWDVHSGRLIQQFKGFHYENNPIYFDEKGELVKPDLEKDTFIVVDPETFEEKLAITDRRTYNPANFCMSRSPSGKYVYHPLPYVSILTNSSLELNWGIEVNAISPDERLFVVARPWTDSIMIGDPAAGKWLWTIGIGSPTSKQGPNSIVQLLFSGDNRYLFASDINEVVTVLDVEKGFKKIRQFPGEWFSISGDGNRLVVLNEGKLDLYNLDDLELLYSYVSLGEENFLVLDEKKRYDGTAQARKSLYFTCETELIDLEQFKDRLWVPGLASRIIDNDSIYTPGIEGLSICGYTPKIEQPRNSSSPWEYEIIPGTGGLGETVVFVNGVEVKRYKLGQLEKKGKAFKLRIDSTELRSYYLSGSGNLVTVRAFTSDNGISSRGLVRKDSLTGGNRPAPNLYALMIGVSDYKGEELDLKYAAKDANDLSKTIKLAAEKLLNTDGRNHVFVYPMTTAEGHYRMPEKLAIRKTIEEISALSTPNDIFLVFFAGHGIVEGEKKQFYFLTSEASGTAGESDFTSMGISTSELTEWIKPANLKAQKRILVFDACNSGQAIRDFVSLGNKEQGYTAARNDDKAQQLKQIEKLNDRAGFTILSAAASNQSAYEFGRYSQGILTYALLKTVKEQPDILANGKYLDINRWFEASRDLVEALVNNDGARQEPQLVSNTNFVIGIVDNEVHSSIKLPLEKPIFGGSIVVNVSGNRDDLRLSRMLNAELSSISSEPEGKLIYIPDHESRDTYLVNGTYSIKDTIITMELVFTRGEELIATKKFAGQKDALNILMSEFRTYLDSFLK